MNLLTFVADLEPAGDWDIMTNFFGDQNLNLVIYSIYKIENCAITGQWYCT